MSEAPTDPSPGEGGKNEDATVVAAGTALAEAEVANDAGDAGAAGDDAASTGAPDEGDAHISMDSATDAPGEDVLRLLFRILDTDGTGQVSKLAILKAVQHDPDVKEMLEAEPHLAPLLHPHVYKETFEAMDTDNDGRIDLQELLAFCAEGGELHTTAAAGKGEGTGADGDDAVDDDLSDDLSDDVEDDGAAEAAEAAEAERIAAEETAAAEAEAAAVAEAEAAAEAEEAERLAEAEHMADDAKVAEAKAAKAAKEAKEAANQASGDDEVKEKEVKGGEGEGGAGSATAKSAKKKKTATPEKKEEAKEAEGGGEVLLDAEEMALLAREHASVLYAYRAAINALFRFYSKACTPVGRSSFTKLAAEESYISQREFILCCKDLGLFYSGSAAAQRRLRKSGNNLPFCTKEECIEVYGREVIEAVIRTKRDGDKVSWARVHPPPGGTYHVDPSCCSLIKRRHTAAGPKHA